MIIFGKRRNKLQRDKKAKEEEMERQRRLPIQNCGTLSRAPIGQNKSVG
jgi:hypothetical protein